MKVDENLEEKLSKSPKIGFGDFAWKVRGEKRLSSVHFEEASTEGRWNNSDIIHSVSAAEPFPKNPLRLFLRNNLTRLKITSEVKNNLKRLFLTLF